MIVQLKVDAPAMIKNIPRRRDIYMVIQNKKKISNEIFFFTWCRNISKYLPNQPNAGLKNSVSSAMTGAAAAWPVITKP